jgi:acetolactate synthase I/II/III large subunit
VVVITEDASFQLNSQELNTVMRYQLPVKVVITNNRSHGMVRQFQDELLGGRYPSTVWGYDPPNFRALALAYGLPYGAVSQSEEVDASLQQLWSKPMEPFLLEVSVLLGTNVHPYVPLGRPLKAMVPATASSPGSNELRAGI